MMRRFIGKPSIVRRVGSAVPGPPLNPIRTPGPGGGEGLTNATSNSNFSVFWLCAVQAKSVRTIPAIKRAIVGISRRPRPLYVVQGTFDLTEDSQILRGVRH